MNNDVNLTLPFSCSIDEKASKNLTQRDVLAICAHKLNASRAMDMQ